MVILLILLVLIVCFGIVLGIIQHKKHRLRLLAAPIFATASTRKLTAEEREAVDNYLSGMFQYQQSPVSNSLLLNNHSGTVYTVSHAITRYGLSTDEPHKWRYYIDATEVHLPPFWEQYITDDNSVELIPTQTLPLVVSLNRHTLQDYVSESRSLLSEYPAISDNPSGSQQSEQIEIVRVRKETRQEHQLHCHKGWQEAVMIVLSLLLFFLCLKVPDLLIPWLVTIATILLLAGIGLIFLPLCGRRTQEIHCLRGIPKQWGLFGEADQEQINTISLGTIDLIYPPHWLPFIHHELGQETDIDIYLNRQVVRQGSFLSLHDEVKNFPLPYWLRSSIIATGAFFVLILLVISAPLEMPLMLTTSWLKGAQTVDVTSVGQLEKAGLRAGDTLKISGNGMCNIHPGAWANHQRSPFAPFDCSQIIWNNNMPLPLPESDTVRKASALLLEVNQQLHPQNDPGKRVNPQLASDIQQSGMILLHNFAAIVLKTQALCIDDDECVRLKNALVNLSNSTDWDTLMYQVKSGKMNSVNVLLRPVSAEALDNLVNASVAPFFIRETNRAAQALNSTPTNGFVIINEEGGELVDQPFPPISLYDYPAQQQWTEFQRLATMLLQTRFNAEGIVTSIRSDSNGTQYIVLHSIPNTTGVGRYVGTSLLLIGLVVCTLYQGVMAARRRQRSRSRIADIQRYYEQCLNARLSERNQ